MKAHMVGTGRHLFDIQEGRTVEVAVAVLIVIEANMPQYENGAFQGVIDNLLHIIPEYDLNFTEPEG
jgi:hypothetical protein